VCQTELSLGCPSQILFSFSFLILALRQTSLVPKTNELSLETYLLVDLHFIHHMTYNNPPNMCWTLNHQNILEMPQGHISLSILQVHKGSTQTNKRSKLGFKRKEQKKPKSTLVWRTGMFGVPLDSVWCTRAVRLRTLHLRISEAALRYNSPDCPVCHRTVRCTKRSNSYLRNGRLHSALTALQYATEVRAAARGAPDSAQYLSGATPYCPVPLEDKAPTVVCVRTLTVG
jgi:hypothetical protein